MELKVWVDNIKRVVCGVTDNTTCQDIVIALAQAMGRTGRFTLIEKWRDNERPLSPDECPLLVLQKWGEFANEVNLILYESGSRRKSKNADKEKEVPKTQDRFTHNFTPPVKTSEAVIRRSLTFSGIRKTDPNHYKRPETNQGNMLNHLANNKLLKPTERVTSDGNSWSSNSSLSSQNSAVISPYARTGRPAASSSAPSRVRSSSQDRMHGTSNPQHFSTLQHSSQGLNPQHSTNHRPAMPNNAMSNQHNSQNHRPYQNNTLDRQRNCMSSENGPSLRSSAFSPVRPRRSSSDDDHETNLIPNPDIPVYTEKVKSSHKVVMEEYDLDSNFPDVVKETGREYLIEEYHMPGRQGQGQVSGNHSNLVSKEEQERVKLLRLVTMQNERIKMQDSQLDIIDTEISSRVQKIEDSKLQLTQISTEINKLSKVFEEQSKEIVTLDNNGTLIEEMEKEKESERKIKNEISSLRVRLEKCENDLHQFHTKVKLCSDELEKEQDILRREEKQKQDEDQKVKQEISEVQEELGKLDIRVSDREDKMKEQDKDLEAISKELTDKSEKLTAIEKDLQRENLRFFQDPQNKQETKPLGSPEADGEAVLKVLEGSLSPHLKQSKIATSPLAVLTVMKSKNGVWV